MSLETRTIGDILKACEIELFPEPKSDFEKLCRIRESAIKNYLDHCGQLVHQNTNLYIDYHGNSFWLKKRIKTNLTNLFKYTGLLVDELNKERIEGHCQHKDRSSFSAFEPDIIFLIFNSINGSIITDILWADDITIGEAINISQNKIELNTLGKYIPRKLKEIEETILPYIINSKYSNYKDSMTEILNSYKSGYFKSCNLLILTTIEGMVRDLAHFLVNKQNLLVSVNDRIYNSLDSLLRKINWKDDIEIDRVHYEMLIQDKEPYIRNYSIPMKLNEKGVLPISTVKINLKLRLDFLRRRFKEDRDMVLHGQLLDYGSPWHLFANFSALIQVFKTIVYYDQYYP